MVDGPSADRNAGSLGRHDERHEVLVAALLDRDLPEGDRGAAERLLRTCSACAALHADLAALAAATKELQPEARTRDFRLTVDDAARLAPSRIAGGEPRGLTTRLTGEMLVPNADHVRHDQLLVASLLDRSAGSAERDRAEALVATCDDCAALHRDLLALREAAQAMPTPPRRRDFTISSEDAARLRRTGWRRLIEAFGSPRDALSRPLAIGLTTLGLAGILAASIPGVLSVGSGAPASVPTIGQALGGAGADSESLEGPRAAALAPSAAASAAPVGAAPVAPTAGPSTEPAPTTEPAPAAASAEPAPSDERFDTFVASPAASAGAAAIAPYANGSAQRQGESVDAAATTSSASPVDRVGVLSLAGLLLVAGLGLFVLRWAGRRI